jgi:hypothetical protein
MVAIANSRVQPNAIVIHASYHIATTGTVLASVEDGQGRDGRKAKRGEREREGAGEDQKEGQEEEVGNLRGFLTKVVRQ